MIKNILPLILALFSLFFNSCSSTNEQVDLSSKTPMYKKAYKDGCTTAKGTYTKDHYAFTNYKIYYDGWFAGRHDCNQ